MKVFLFLVLSIFFLNAKSFEIPPISTKRYHFHINNIDATLPYESNYSINKTNKKIKRLILAIHSSNYNADLYVNNTHKVATLLHKEKTSLILAPQFITKSLLSKKSDFLHWQTYPFLGSSRAIYKGEKVRVSAFEVLDSLINKIIQSKQFENLKQVVLLGHSAGAQFVNRYAAYKGSNSYSLPIRYIVMAPSSYLYFDKMRSKKGYKNKFEIPSVESVKYNKWAFGLEKLYEVHRRNKVDGSKMIENYKSCEVIYLVGSKDNDPNDATLSKKYGAILQGAHRLQRAKTYYRYLQKFYTKEIMKKQHFHIIKGVGHSSKALISSSIAKKYIFLD